MALAIGWGDRRRRQGAALLLTLAVLAVLALLASGFVRMQGLERQASHQHTDEVRARMMARAGVELAVARLREQAARLSYDPPEADWTYRGEDLDNNYRVDAGEDVVTPGELSRADCPLPQALAPSFAHPTNAARLAAGKPAVSGLRPTAGGFWSEADQVYSLPGATTAVPAGYYESSFTLRVRDCASMIDVNGGRFGVDAAGRVVPRPTPDAKLVDITAEIIDRLYEAIRQEAGLAGPYDLARIQGKGLGRLLMDGLAAAGRTGGFASKAGLQQAVRSLTPDPQVGAEIWRRLDPLLTCHAWRDPTVIAPVPFDDAQLIGVRRFERLDLQPRAPIDVNTADWKVLYAMLAGLSGRTVIHALETDVRRSGARLFAPNKHPLVTLSPAKATYLARRIVEVRFDPATGTATPFRNWDDFGAFLEAEVAANRVTADERDLVLAQAAPDSQLNKFNPDAVVQRKIDKSDLYDHRTELCFSSLGVYEITSLGRVGWDRHTLAAAELTTVVRVYEVVRETTYRDFEAGALAATGGAPWLAVYPGTAARAGAPGQAPYDGRVGLRTSDPAPPLKVLWKAPFGPGHDALAEGGVAHPQLRPLIGPAPQGTATVDGAYSGYLNDGTPAYPAYASRVGMSSPRIDPKRGLIAFWYKPNFELARRPLRPHSLIDINGPDNEMTAQLYYEGSRVGIVSQAIGGVPQAGPKMVFLFWDKKGAREVRAEFPLIDEDGDPIISANQWTHISLMWDARKFVVNFRGKPKKPKGGGGGPKPGGPPVLLSDDTGLGGPLVIYQRRGGKGGGFLSISYWKPVPDDAGGGGPGPGPTPPAEVEMTFGPRIRLGGPLKYRARPRDLTYAGPSMAPSDGTYGHVYSLQRTPVDPDAENRDISAALQVNPDLTLTAADPDYAAIQAVYGAGRYYNGNGLKPGDPQPFAYFTSQSLAPSAGHPLGTITWRGHLPVDTSLEVRLLRRQGGAWVEVPDPSDGTKPLAFDTPGECPIPRSAVDAGLTAAERRGEVRYRVVFIESLAEDEGLVEVPYLESVTVTVLSPATHLVWRWS